MARRIGVAAVLVAVVAVTLWFFAHPVSSVRYVGTTYFDAAEVSVDVRLRMFGSATPPESVTVEVRDQKVVARKLR